MGNHFSISMKLLLVFLRWKATEGLTELMFERNDGLWAIDGLNCRLYGPVISSSLNFIGLLCSTKVVGEEPLSVVTAY